MNLHNKLGKSLQSGMVYRTFTIQPKFTADFGVGQSREQGVLCREGGVADDFNKISCPLYGYRKTILMV